MRPAGWRCWRARRCVASWGLIWDESKCPMARRCRGPTDCWKGTTGIGAVCRGKSGAGGARLESGRRHHRGSHHHQCAEFNQERRQAARPPDHQTRKGQQWYFGMKMHMGVDSRSGPARSAMMTAANVHDRHALLDLLHGNERRVDDGSAYASQKDLIGSKATLSRNFANELVSRTVKLTKPSARKIAASTRSPSASSTSLRWSSGCRWHQGALPCVGRERHSILRGYGFGQYLSGAPASCG